MQQAKLCNYTIDWHQNVETLPNNKPLFFVANELFDALPIHQFMHKDGEWHEHVVAAKDSHLTFAYVPTTPPTHLPDKPDTLFETSPLSHMIMQTLADRIRQQSGLGIIIDYGYVHGSGGDTLQALKQHQFHDILSTPGEADLTAHVDFKALAKTARNHGAIPHPITTQKYFIETLGGEMRLQQLLQNTQTQEQKTQLLSGYDRLTSPDHMGDLFKVLAITHADLPVPASISS
jgi:NADH dehydrogenase [ubiquinone] 1 alpha subcomplex assembly factor 7